jgi:hypothetical protein
MALQSSWHFDVIEALPHGPPGRAPIPVIGSLANPLSRPSL